jgi:hypothetical protein
MRHLLKKHYIELRNIIDDDIPYSFETNIVLTHYFETSKAAHQRLNWIMKRECERVMNIDNNLEMLPDTILHIADVEEFHWLLQPELKAIKDGLIYVEDKVFN